MDFQKTLKLTWGDKKTRVRGDLTAVVWKDKQNINLLTYSPAEGNFCDKHDDDLKPKIVQDYNKYMGYTDKCHRMTDSYSISRWTWKWKKKLYSPSQPDNPEQFHSPRLLWCKSTDFRLTLIKDLIQEAGRFPWIQTALRGRPTPLTAKLTRLDFRQNTHWPWAANCVFGGKQTNWAKVNCEICDIGLCLQPCFKIYHIELYFWSSSIWKKPRIHKRK
jgi:hypothetical protein